MSKIPEKDWDYAGAFVAPEVKLQRELIKNLSDVDIVALELLDLILEELFFWYAGSHPANCSMFRMPPDFYLCVFASHLVVGENNLRVRIKAILEERKYG